MPQYAILIYGDETVYKGMSPETRAELHAAHGAFAKSVAELGATISGGEALDYAETARSVRGDVVTDGPFAETKEAFGGFYVVDARDLDHALEIARRCPAPGGGVEVRPVVDVSAS